MSNATQDDAQSQIDKFKQAARELECDEDEGRFRERLGKLVMHKPVEKLGTLGESTDAKREDVGRR